MNDFLENNQITDFKNIIGSYAPNEESLKNFLSSKFCVIAGPAVSGKDTLRDGLISNYPQTYQKILSLTTRAPRQDEITKDSYKFISVENMRDLAVKQKLLQIALVHNQQISAIDIRQIEELQEDKIGLSILIVQTEQELYKIKPDIKTIFLIPPNFEDLMDRINRERLPDQTEIKRRLAAAEEEIGIALKTPRYYCIASDIKQNVQEKAHLFLSKEQRDSGEEKRARDICKEILEDIKKRKNND